MRAPGAILSTLGGQQSDELTLPHLDPKPFGLGVDCPQRHVEGRPIHIGDVHGYLNHFPLR
jgi:hypothetical protein